MNTNDLISKIYKRIIETQESNVTDMGNILRMNPCPEQKKLCWDEYDGWVFVHKKVNPNFSKDKPYAMVIDVDGKWQMHFENFSKLDQSKKKMVMDDLYSAISQTCKKGMELYLLGGCTPGGISGLTKLENYGFKKVFTSLSSNAYWGGELDRSKLDEKLNDGKHLDMFLVTKDGKDHKWNITGSNWILARNYKGTERFSENNTKPRPFKMVKI